jgi:hypothetical protein
MPHGIKCVLYFLSFTYTVCPALFPPAHLHIKSYFFDLLNSDTIFPLASSPHAYKWNKAWNNQFR